MSLNKILVIELMVLLLVGTMGCSDYLEEEPKDRLVASNFFNNSDDMMAAMNSVLNAASQVYDNTTALAPHAGSEQLTAVNLHPEKLPFREFDRYDVPANNKRAVEIWNNNYTLIRNANWMIDNVNNVPVSEGTKDMVKAMCQTLQAHSYFNLTRLWGDIPLNYGYNGNFSDAEFATTEKAYEYIVELLTSAGDKLPAAYTAEEVSALYDAQAWADLPDIWKAAGDRSNVSGRGNRSLPTSGWSKAILANVYLHMGGWPLNQTDKYAMAASTAKEIIDDADRYGYGLMDDYQDLWLFANDFNKEQIVIFGYNRLGSATNLAPEGLRPFEEFGLKWTNAWYDVIVEPQYFLGYPDSYRKEVSFTTGWYDLSDRDGEDNPQFLPENWIEWQDSRSKAPHIAKWRSTEDFPHDSTYAAVPESSSRAVHTYRYAHVLLTYAEAQARSGGINADALEAVNMVRRRANRLPVDAASAVDLSAAMGAEAFIDAVVSERNYEFVGEFESRWFDLQRLEMVEEVAKDIQDWRNANPEMMAEQVGNIEVLPTREKYYLELPTVDVTMNPNFFNNN